MTGHPRHFLSFSKNQTVQIIGIIIVLLSLRYSKIFYPLVGFLLFLIARLCISELPAFYPHFNAIAYGIFADRNGSHLLLDGFSNTYGLYAILLSRLLWFIKMTPYSISVIFTLLGLFNFFCYFPFPITSSEMRF